ncbi:pyrroline-5-carboxylate reductase [Bacillus pinisoli]|uniref:pyrroline-5-carboxylate reductase n=1 Tax=Bacillus pinisoli TaxID=2901866 RepID=UPI001FF1CE76|nr:pyrroline-5-carboxylate reductase [Bacillus pinisoli]
MNKRIGFIGCGKMGQAMITGMLHSSLVRSDQIIGSARSDETLLVVEQKFNINVTLSNQEVASSSDFLFIAVKPHLYKEVLQEVKDHVKQDAIIITIAAGIDISFIEAQFDHDVKVIRSMPNTPSLVGEGMSVLCVNNLVSEEEKEQVISLFNSFGKSEIVEEAMLDAIPAISGSSPAYVYMFIEALADGGVMQGIPRKLAYKLAAQAVLGAAKMVLETDKHPGELKDEVCTPGGVTIEAVATLEKNQFRGAVLSAMENCTNKSRILAKK